MLRVLFAIAIVSLVTTGCYTHNDGRHPRKVPAQYRSAQSFDSLHDYFRQVYALSRSHDRNSQAWEALGNTLHEQLRAKGDAAFATALAEESNDIQTEVVNCMGLTDLSIYDKYPKTKQVLSAAPKI